MEAEQDVYEALGGLRIITLKALANSSPGLLQPWVNNADEILRNSEGVAIALRCQLRPKSFQG
jgi:hypothetical protein